MGIYIHLPFEDYNDMTFDYFTRNDIEVNKYFENLKAEIGLYNNKLDEVKWIFFGGGSPTSIDANYIEEILKEIELYYNISNAQISLELELYEIDNIKIEKYKKMGINRLSIRLRSLDDKELEYINYPLNRGEIIERLKIILKYYEDVNVDIHNPWLQSLGEYFVNLKELVSMKIPHISVYQHSLDMGIDYWDIYLDIRRYLINSGYRPYHYLHWAKSGYESVYLNSISSLENYIGIGLSASGNLKDIRYKNTEDPEYYYEKIKNKKRPRSSYKLDLEDRKLEYIVLNLERNKGIVFEEYNRIFNENFLIKYKEQLNYLKKLDLINIEDDKFYLKEGSYLEIDKISKQFIKKLDKQ